MTGLFVTATGWTLPQLEAIPWPEALDLLDYWSRNPPIHMAVQGMLGIEHEDPEQEVIRPYSEADIDALIGQLQG